MEYISAEKFLEQSEKVQKVLLDWWQPQIGERIYSTGISSGECIYLGDYKDSGYEVLRLESKEKAVTDKKVFVPLFTEGQLRNFIEDKTKGKISINHFRRNGYSIGIFNKNEQMVINFRCVSFDLLETYWIVACKLAEEMQGL